MPIPDFQTLLHPLLHFAAEAPEQRLRDAYPVLAERFRLSEAERQTLVPSGQQYLFHNRITWAASYLRKAELLAAHGRGVFAITPRGREALRSGEPVDIDYLMRFEAFREFRSRAAANRAPRRDRSLPAGIDEATESLTPQETLEFAWRAMRNDLESDLIERMRRIAPTRFERLVLDVLLAMGYGSHSPYAGQSVGRSGDGGIDGLINEDPLGLETIYLQAKRWEQPVGRPEIQKFAGALAGRRARKGVFITTSEFTREARDYIEQIDSRIILIDGMNLARLMIDHGVGVATVDRFEIKQLDSDYFLDD